MLGTSYVTVNYMLTPFNSNAVCLSAVYCKRMPYAAVRLCAIQSLLFVQLYSICVLFKGRVVAI